MDYSLVLNLVKKTRDIILSGNKSDYKMKGDADFVTDIDISVSEFLKEKLKEINSDIGFFSEEDTGHLTDNCWILDPIDGTTNLIFGYNLSSVSLAHYLNGEIVFGVVYNPFTQEMFSAEKGKGAFLNGNITLRVNAHRINESLIEFGAGSTHKEDAEKNFKLAMEIFKNCIDVRRICSSALDLCYIAAGRIDGYFEKILKPWDIAAGSLILEEAGGKITDYSGKKVQFSKSTSVIAGNGVNNDFLIKTISEFN